MKYHVVVIVVVLLISLIVFPLMLFYSLQYFSRAADVHPNIFIDAQQTLGPIRPIWKSYAQGGEQSNTQMLSNIITKTAALQPRYIRLDHIYDFYNVVHKNEDGSLTMSWDQLDKSVCDIYATGAKPFFSLGYMPPDLSSSHSLIDPPTHWSDWSYIVQKTIEHYSGTQTTLCGSTTGAALQDIYYEVWNEPNLDTFGSWSMKNSAKDYRQLYAASIQGAIHARNVYRFAIGGPALSSLDSVWMRSFLDYISQQKLRLDFISWHRYAHGSESFHTDSQTIESMLSEQKYLQYRGLPRLITEWGYDSLNNESLNAPIAAAHTVSAIRNLLDYPFFSVFSFELRDGPNSNWGIFKLDGTPKPRYQALLLLNQLLGDRLQVTGEGTYVQAISSKLGNTINTILVNYDPTSSHSELVPITFTNLVPGAYKLTIADVNDTVILDRTFDHVSTQMRIQIPLTYNGIMHLKTVLLEAAPTSEPLPRSVITPVNHIQISP